MILPPSSTRTGSLVTINSASLALQNPDLIGISVNPTGGGTTGGAMAAGVYYVRQALYAGTPTAYNQLVASSESQAFTVAAGNIPQIAAPNVTQAQYPSLFNAAGAFTGTLVTYCTQPGGTTGSEIEYSSQTTLGAVSMAAVVPSSGASAPTASTPALGVNTGTGITFPAITWDNTETGFWDYSYTVSSTVGQQVQEYVFAVVSGQFGTKRAAEYLVGYGTTGTGNGSVEFTIETSATGNAPIDAASVSLNSGAIQVASGITNSNGQVTLSAPAAVGGTAYTLIITASGYESSDTTYTLMPGAASSPVVMQLTPNFIPTPAYPGQSVGSGVATDGSGNGLPNVTMSFVMTVAPSGAGIQPSASPVTATTNTTGNYTVTLIQGGTYVGTGTTVDGATGATQKTIVVPYSNNFEIPNFIVG